MRCAECRFWDRTYKSDPPMDCDQGTCRRCHPQVTSSGYTHWPQVMASDWCGQGEPVGTADTTKSPTDKDALDGLREAMLCSLKAWGDEGFPWTTARVDIALCAERGDTAYRVSIKDLFLDSERYQNSRGPVLSFHCNNSEKPIDFFR